MASKDPIYLRVLRDGTFSPADSYAQSQLRDRGYRIGDLIKCHMTKPNNPKFHRLIHRIGQLCAANLERFDGMDAHKVIKVLQLESNTACEEIGVLIDGFGMQNVRIPQSMSFSSMDDGERHEFARSVCRWIALKYWPTMTAEQIEEMAESFIGD